MTSEEIGAEVRVCGRKDEPPSGVLKLSVASRAPIHNQPQWKCLWRLSPFSVVEGGVAVPGLDGVRSQTVENAWQFLKLWPGEEGWREEDAREAFRSPCAIRYPRGRGQKAEGAYWGHDGSILGYIEARKRIYVPCYLEMLAQPDRVELIERLREAAMRQAVWVWDFDSYEVGASGMRDILEALEFEKRPFVHAFLVALAVQGRLKALRGASDTHRGADRVADP
jgi:hypothetical protein